jgi:alpha-tubulin suppressor-like RCC1 family protein
MHSAGGTAGDSAADGGDAGSAGSATTGGTAGDTSGGVSGRGGAAGNHQAGSGGTNSCTDPGRRECDGTQALRECSDGTWKSRECASPCAGAACAQVKQIALGHAHGCAVLDDGSARCWGAGEFGKLGNGRKADQLLPVTALGMDASAPLTQVEELALGVHHTCALLQDKTVRCWGHNAYGQLGSGEKTASGLVTVRASATADEPLSTVTQVAAGGFQTCAVLEDGSVRCWGKGQDGQLGNGKSGAASGALIASTVLSAQDPSKPLSAIRQVSVGYWHACAVSNSGTAFCWGSNETGQLGNGVAVRRQPYAVPVLDPDTRQPLTGVSRIAAGYWHTCALRSTGTVLCWGDDRYGQLGDGKSGPSAQSLVPTSVLNSTGEGSLAGVVEVAAGYSHSCARLEGGSVQCWGSNRYGQLGDGHSGAGVISAKPVVAFNGQPAASATLALGMAHSCLLTEFDALMCWGRNDHGQLTAKYDAAVPRRFFWWEHD